MIIITRPSPYGESLMALCQAKGFVAQHLPLFNITAAIDAKTLQNHLNTLKADDVVIVTSSQVIEMINQYQTTIKFPPHIRYCAVGKQTATRFSLLTQQIVESPSTDESSEGLFEYLTMQPRPLLRQKILILCGTNGRTLLKDRLSLLVTNVENIYIYHKDRITHPITILDDYIDTLSNINILVVTSVAHLLEIEKYCFEKQKQQLILIVSSMRIKQFAKTLGWNKIHLAQNANNQNLLSAISTLHHNVTMANSLG